MIAHQRFGYPLKGPDGSPRRQGQPERLVVIVESCGEHLKQHGCALAFFRGSFWGYTGTHWAEIVESAFARSLGEYAERLGHRPTESRYWEFQEKLVKQARATFGIEEPNRNLDLTLVNFQNGTFEIDEAGEQLRGFNSGDLLTYQLPFDLDREATCPMFDRYLQRVLPDPASRDVIAEFLGSIFLRGLKHEKILVLLGDGHNGKSVLFDIVNSLLGASNVSNLGLSALSKAENRFKLAGALLNFGSEISDRCDPDLLKKLASGEPIEARRLYQDIYVIREYARLAFNANVLPKNTEQTRGFFRRFIIVPFNETISEEEKDPDLARKIAQSELPGVFNWILSGLRRLRSRRTFTECKAARDALETYRKESDSVAMFLEDECFVPSVDGRWGKGELYGSYRDYCRASGYLPLGKNNFGKRLERQHRISSSKSGGFRFWHLIRQEEEMN